MLVLGAYPQTTFRFIIIIEYDGTLDATKAYTHTHTHTHTHLIEGLLSNFKKHNFQGSSLEWLRYILIERCDCITYLC